MVNIEKKWRGVALFALFFGLGSCVDSKYDLDKDIDWTITVGGDYLTVPVGTTDTIFLSKIIDLEKDGMLGVDGNHEYHLTKKGVIEVEPTSVSKVQIAQVVTEMTPIVVVDKVKNNAFSFLSGENVSAEVHTSGALETNVTGIDEALKELGEITASEPSLLTLTFEFEKGEGIEYDKVLADGLTFVFPDFIQFEPGQELLRGNSLVLPKGYVMSSDGSSNHVELKVTGYKFNDKAGTAEAMKPVNGELLISGVIQAEGRVLTTGVVKGGMLSMTPKAVLAPMEINRVVGVIQPEITVEDTQIALTGLPDFLKDESTRLDISNPVFLFKAENSLNTEVVLDAVLTPEREGKDLSANQVVVNGLKLAPASEGETFIALSRTGVSGISGASDTQVEDINKLIEVIPDFINVELKPRVENNQFYGAELGIDYEFPSSYDVDVPLCFESNLNIVYQDSITELNKDLADLDKVDFRVANFIFTAVNTVPLQLEAKPENVEIKDRDGKVIDNIKVENNGRHIAESKDGKEKVESEFTLKLTSKEPNVLSRIDCITFKVTAVPGQATNVPLKDEQWLKMTKIRLNVPGGIKLDLN